MADNILKISKIKKSFGSVLALKNVNLTVAKPEVHALIGENGAGKSTLMKILSGAYVLDHGNIEFLGKKYEVKTPAEGRRAKIAMIYQELTIVPNLSVAENICLGIEDACFGFRKMNKGKIKDCLDLLGHKDLDIDKPAGAFSIGLQQVMEIARAIYSDAKLIIMDEPTSSLSAKDTQLLFKVIRNLKSKNISIVYISHFLEEVKDIADSFTVLRDGETVAKGSIEDVTVEQLVEYMVGRSIEEMYPKSKHKIGESVFKVEALEGYFLPKKVAFELRKGEILGIAGLVGSGRTETLRAIFGLDKLKKGTISINGKALVKKISSSNSLKNSLDMLSENRKEEGLATSMTLTFNTTLSALKKYQRFGFLNLKKEQEDAKVWNKKLSVKFEKISQKISQLSGGNQQKVAIARILNHNSDILFIDEPTRGIDVGSKAEIYNLILKLAETGKSIILVSSYLPEILGICDSVIVMHRGRMSPKYKISDSSEHKIMHFATSGIDTFIS